jgi:superfamily II DNA or RNA helicase
MVMNLSTRLAGNFTRSVRKRGDEYYSQRRVHIREGSESKLCANVRGSQLYAVRLEFNEGLLSVWCGCPYFEDCGIPCKHLWATLVAGEEEGYLSAAASAGTLGLDSDDCGFDDEEDEIEYEAEPAPPVSTRSRDVVHDLPASNRFSWQRVFSEIVAGPIQSGWPVAQWPAKREVLYVIEVANSLSRGGLFLSLQSRDRKVDGTWTRPKPLAVEERQIARMPVAEDLEILSALAGGDQYGYSLYEPLAGSFLMTSALAGLLIPLMARTGRCYLRAHGGAEIVSPITLDERGAWNFELEVRRLEKGGCALIGFFRRGEELMDLSVPVLVAQGQVFTMDRVAPLADRASSEWIAALRDKGSITATEKEQDEFLAALLCSSKLPPLTVSEELRYREMAPQAYPRLRIFKERAYNRQERLRAELSFAYNGQLFSEFDTARGFFDSANRQFLRRDRDAESAASDLLEQLGVKLHGANYLQPEPIREVPPSKLPRIVRSLVEARWHVEAENKIFRHPGSFHIEVSSGVDWFELHGGVDYGNTMARLPELLRAAHGGEQMVRLDDGSYGMLPEEWLRRISRVAAMGRAENGHIRFGRSQAGLLDALLATQTEARCDDTFAAFREQLKGFDGIEPSEQPAGFVGRLRDYQSEGLGWMHFLRRFSFGGCLADDMGVGKTAQALALFETRRVLRAAGEPIAPSLVVVPRSLVFNWKQEAARFTPQLRVLDHSGLERKGEDFAAYDIVVTTYGTLRRDILRLKDFEFDYVVLDEAQAIKNASTQAAKAARLLRGRCRLALSGTPVENHLRELWSLFEFLNPGMLGGASAFKLASGALRDPDEETRRLLGQALRPFILRRTKEQVARELPPKSEQTMYCEMDAAERKLYEDLRQYYRRSLLKRIETEGMAKSKIKVLEALLRLRQAACHPGLIDKERVGDSSAKLEMLLEQLREVLDEGHKALVFSQFTSLLKIVRDRLDRNDTAYEYLDGATRDRQARVERFQKEEDCRTFLVSLKAGGLGLNLTAAEYVFILDPWWNPAVEAQAVDRAHRIGQSRSVFAYRLITRDTVEDKVLELQKAKRDLAASIITAENSIIRNLQPEDLALLLS